MVFTAPGPYPVIGDMKKNRMYARMMLDNYGGIISEMSAIALYLNDAIQEGEQQETARIFMGIAEVEMHHLHIFGTLAYRLGEKPILRTMQGNRYASWSCYYTPYPTEWLPLLHTALHCERQTIQKYTRQMERVEEPLIQACLQRIIQDEEVHVTIFERMIAQTTAQNAP